MKEQPKTPMQFSRIGVIICTTLSIVVLIMLIFRLILQAAEPFSHDTLTATCRYIFIHLVVIGFVWVPFIVVYGFYLEDHRLTNKTK